MALNIKIENFEGPFDLLLHLIKKNQMDIYHVKIHEITKQYIEYIRYMKQMDLEIASEFIVIASTLLEIKSRQLLPKSPIQKDENEEETEETFVKKLIEYNKFKKVAEFLKNKQEYTGAIYTKKPEIIDDIKKNTNEENFLNGVTMLKLFDIYSTLMNDYLNKLNKNGIIDKEILIDDFKLEDKMALLKYEIENKNKIKFSDVRKKCRKKMEIVVSFLAMLELIRLKVVKVYQENNLSEIYIESWRDDERE